MALPLDPDVAAAFGEPTPKPASGGAIVIPKSALPSALDPDVAAAFADQKPTGGLDPDVAAAFGGAPAAPKPSPLFFAQPQPDAPAVKTAVQERENRDSTAARSLMNGGLVQKFRNDALTQSLFGESPDVGNRTAKLAGDYDQAQQQMSGRAPAADMPGTTGDKEHLDLPSFLQRYGVAGLRPAGVAYKSFADRLNRHLQSENPNLSDEQINKKMWQDGLLTTAVKRPDVTMGALKDAADTLTSPSRLFDANVPTIIDAPGQVVGKYGETGKGASDAGSPWATAMNMARAITDTPAGIFAANAQNERFSKALQGKGAMPEVKPLSQVLDTTGPESPQDLSGRTAPGPGGLRITPAQANVLGFAAAPYVDVLPVAARGAKLGVKGAGYAANAVAESAPFLPATTAARVAMDQASSAIRRLGPVDKVGASLFGADWDARQGQLQYDALRRAQPQLGLPESPPGIAQDVRAAIRQVPGRQTLDMRDLAEQAKNMKVDPAHWPDFSTALEDPDPKARAAALAHLTPAEQLAAATYENRALSEKARQAAVMPVKTRDNYMAGMPTEQVAERVPLKVEAAGRRAAGTAFEDQVATPQKIRYNAQRTLPENLSDEAGYPIITRTQVEDYFQKKLAAPGTSPIVDYFAKDWQLKPGEPVWELDPQKNFTRRFIPGTLQTVQAEAYSKMKPLAIDHENVQPGFAATPNGSVLAGTTGPQIPAAWQRMALREEAPSPSNDLLDVLKKPTGWWKEGVTTMSGPAYHARNKLFSLLKRGGEFNPGELIQQEQAIEKLKAGSNEPFAGIPLQDIGKYAAQEGTWAGTGGGPSSDIASMREAAGVGQPQTLAGKVAKVAAAPLNAVRGAAGAVANATDEGERMRAILGRLSQNEALGSPEARLKDARDFGFKTIVSTGDKSPAAKAVAQAFPFVQWNVREAPNTAMNFAQGKMPLAPRLVQLANANADQENKVPEKFTAERAREGQAFPWNMRGERGMPMYMNLPGSPVQVMTSIGTPVYEAAQMALGKTSPGELGKSVVDTATQNMLPGLSLGLAAASGTKPLSHTDINAISKAPAAEQVLANLSPKLAKEVGMVQGQDGTWYGSGLLALASNAMPWSPYTRALAARTPQERERALGSAVGLTAMEIDPSQENQVRRMAIEEDAKKEQRLLTGPGGLPARLVFKKH